MTKKHPEAQLDSAVHFDDQAIGNSAEGKVVTADHFDDQADLSGQQLSQLVEISGVDLSGSAQALAALAVDELARAQMSVLRAGAYFIALKQMLPHGEFRPYVEKIGVDGRTVRRAMQVARFIASLPADQAKRISTLPKMKILPLINAEPEVIEDLLDSGALDGQQPLSVRALRKQLADSESERARLEARLDLTAQRTKDLERIEQRTRIPAIYREVREEALFASTEVTALLEHLDDVVQRSLIDEQRHPERMRWSPASARTVDGCLAGITARVEEIRNRLRAIYPPSDDPDVVVDAQFEPAELARFEQLRQSLFPRLEAERKAREDERANTAFGRRGRRRGSKG